MIKWIVFAVISLLWISVCWFFGSMVALTDSGPRSSIAQQGCAQRLYRESGGIGDYQDFYYSAQCSDLQQAVSKELAKPAQRNGLLIGWVPVLLVGGLMLYSRRYRRARLGDDRARPGSYPPR